MRKPESTRLQQTADIEARSGIRSPIVVLDRCIKKVEACMTKSVAVDPTFAAVDHRMRPVPGAEPIVAAPLTAELSELGRLDRCRIAALAGLTPIARNSGKRTGRHTIGDSRPIVRIMQYIAALHASRQCPSFQNFRHLLQDDGKTRQIHRHSDRAQAPHHFQSHDCNRHRLPPSRFDLIQVPVKPARFSSTTRQDYPHRHIGKKLASVRCRGHAGVVTHLTDSAASSLAGLGWSAFFADQLAPEEAGLDRMRIATVHRSRLTAESVTGAMRLNLPANARTTDFAVGDWVLVEPETHMLVRRLERQALLQRRTEGGRPRQLIAANVDTLFVVTSCNEDFNPARLERYLALANEAGTKPVIVLTKADQTADAAPYVAQAAALQRGLEVAVVNAKTPEAAQVLAPWCGPGQTVALVGSSGVGKSTLLNTLSGKTAEDAQPTGSIREDDAKGRHTTTSRSLHAIRGGGWVIDTPGMRTLHVSNISDGLDMVFAEIAELAPSCHFGDCTHDHEPGCAIQAAIRAGTIDPARLDRWRKLLEENRANTPVQSGPRNNKIPKARGKRR